MRPSFRILPLLLALFITPALTSAQLTIAGRVSDSFGRGLTAAQVRIEGTTIGTAADNDGVYRLVVQAPRPGMVLLVRALGYKPVRQPLPQTAGSLTQDFRLTADVLRLGEVVVTTSRTETERSTLGTTIATVSGNDIAQANTPQLDAALAGKVSGALVQQMSGTPGGGTSVRIRGLSTLSRSAEPLYILDGVIVDNSSNQLIDLGGYSSNRIADIDPNEIDHIEIVKGAAAAALYGSRANDGVVQIFTKRGRAGALRTSFRTTFQTDDVERRLEVNRAPVDALGNSVTRYDFQDQIFQSAPRFSNTLSFAGGDEKTTFFLSGTSENQEGVIRSTDYRRRNIRLNLDRALTERLRIGVTTAYITSRANVLPNSGLTAGLGVLTSFLFHPNTINFERDPVTGLFPVGPNLANPLEMIANWQAPQNIDRFIGGLSVTAFPISGLTATYRFGFDGYTQNAQLFIPRGNSAPSVPTGRSVSTTDRAKFINADIDLSYITELGTRLKLTHGLGMNWQRQQVDIVASRAENLALLTRTVTGSEQFISEGRDERRTLGIYGQEQIGVNERLFITGSLRSDASSAFGSDVRQQWFPKIGAALNVSDFDFWKGFSGLVSTARLRAAYGFSGGQPAGSFDRLSNYVFEANGTRSGIVNSTQQGNEQLKPERAQELELGTDLAFFDGRVGLELTYFNKKVTDLILPRAVDPTSGFLSQLSNVGELENNGVELLLRTTNIRMPMFSWSSTVTYATNNPKVTKVSSGGAFFIPESFNVIRVDSGQAPGHYFGTSYVRDAQGNILTSAGVPIKDASGKVTGIPAIGPRIIIGDPNPDAYWSLINEIGVGRSLSFRAQFDGVRGGDIFNFDRRLLETPAFGAGKAYEAELLGEVPRGYFQARRSIFQEYMESGTWTKLRELAVTYSFPEGMLGRLGTHGAAVTLSGRNLKTWTDYTGWDPETNAGAQRTLVRGFSFAATPIPRSVALTFSTNF